MKKILTLLLLAMAIVIAPVTVFAQETNPLTPTAIAVEVEEEKEEYVLAYARTIQPIVPNQSFWDEEKGTEVPGVFFPDPGQEGRTLVIGKFLAIADITAELENGVVFYNYTFHIMNVVVVKN